MSDFECAVAMECLAGAYAWRDLHDPHLMAHLDMEQVFGLAQRAGFSEEAAGRIATAHGNARLDRNLPP